MFFRTGDRTGTGPLERETEEGRDCAYLDAHRDRFGVEPICTVLRQAGITIAPSTYRRPPLSALGAGLAG